MNLVEVTKDKEAVCRPILDALPQWFGLQEAKENYIREARELEMFACVVDQTAVAFLALKFHNEFAAEVHTMGVLPEWHRHGLGTRLLRHAELHVASRGIRFLTVKTLSPRKPEKSYEATRQFYRAAGFVPLEELPDLWGPKNPCLMMIKCVRGRNG